MYTEKLLNYYVAGATIGIESDGPTPFGPGGRVSSSTPTPNASCSRARRPRARSPWRWPTTPRRSVIPVTCTGLTAGSRSGQQHRTGLSTRSPAARCPRPTPATPTPPTTTIGAPGRRWSPVHPGQDRRGQRTNRTSCQEQRGPHRAPGGLHHRRRQLLDRRPGQRRHHQRSQSNGSVAATRHQQPDRPPTSPAILNAYATPGTTDADRDALGRLGRLDHHQPRRHLRPVPLGRLGGRRRQRRLQPDLLLLVDRRRALDRAPDSVVSTDYTFAASVAQDSPGQGPTRRSGSAPTTRAGPTDRAWSRTPTAP